MNDRMTGLWVVIESYQSLPSRVFVHNKESDAEARLVELTTNSDDNYEYTIIES
jgi:hypothetical protein